MLAQRRHAGLDVLRAAAVLLTFFRHIPLDYLSVLHGPLLPLVRGGLMGVDLFFVLSGFLVGGLLFREYPHVWIRQFLLRRALKIYPAFWFFLAVWVAAGLTFRPVAPQYALAELLLVQNYFDGLFTHTWSLAVEEHFYLLASAGVVVAQRKGLPLRHVPYAMALLVALCFLARLAMHQMSDVQATHIRLDQLAIGVTLAAWHATGTLAKVRAWMRPRRVLVGALALIACAPPFLVEVTTSRLLFVAGLPLFGVGAALWICLALDWTGPAWVARLGRDSYSIYLWHLPVFYILWPLASSVSSPWAWLAVASICGVSVGMLMSALVEWPVLRWRDRWMPPALSTAGNVV